MTASAERTEHDLLGARTLPCHAPDYGIHACARWKFSDQRRADFGVSRGGFARPASNKPPPKPMPSWACCPRPSAGRLSPPAPKSVPALHWHFVVDVIQGRRRRLHQYEHNEVIANRALELMGHQRGDYQHLHPHRIVSLSQSTNDVYPTALKLAAYFGISRLREAMAYLRQAFADRAEAFADVLKMGRTQLQDARCR